MASRRVPMAPPPYPTDRETLERQVVMETFRASGPGGQHVNRTESALRLYHPPSGVIVVVRDSPSQHRNRDIAFARLEASLARLNQVRRKRVATRPTKASQERRILEKKARSLQKRGRERVHREE